MNKEIMKAAGFEKEVQAVEDKHCPFCAKVIKMKDFKDALSEKEYEISGLCQKCQDIMFK